MVCIIMIQAKTDIRLFQLFVNWNKRCAKQKGLGRGMHSLSSKMYVFGYFFTSSCLLSLRRRHAASSYLGTVAVWG